MDHKEMKSGLDTFGSQQGTRDQDLQVPLKNGNILAGFITISFSTTLLQGITNYKGTNEQSMMLQNAFKNSEQSVVHATTDTACQSRLEIMK